MGILLLDTTPPREEVLIMKRSEAEASLEKWRAHRNSMNWNLSRVAQAGEAPKESNVSNVDLW